MAVLYACALIAPFATEGAAAAERATTIVLPAQPLSRALGELGRQTGVDVLASPAVVGNRRAPAVRARLTPGQALERLLADSGLTYELAEPGVYVVRVRPNAPAEKPEPPTALPELLIVGVRSQNVDQPRDPDDIQPYQVFERSTLRGAQSLSADDFLQTWLTANTYSYQSVPGRQRGLPPSRSNFAFRNPSAQGATLVLVDGRRMPAVALSNQMTQADVAPIPLAAIGRIESLGSSSGALYGLGAVNGVVNLVLDRDYNGAEVAATYGAGKKGDGEYGRFDARLGWSSKDGGTAMMIRYGQRRYNGVTVGDRVEAYAPLDGSQRKVGQTYNYPSGNGVTLYGVSGPFTVAGVSMLKSYIPADYDGREPIEAVLIRNAGLSAPGLAPAHRNAQLTTDSRSDAVLANLRQRLWPGAEAYVDYIYLASHDAYFAPYGAFSTRLTPGQGAGARFSGSGPIELVAPTPYSAGTTDTRTISRRVTVGLVFDLPARWRGGVDYAVGSARYRGLADDLAFPYEAPQNVAAGTTPDGRAAPNPFGDQAKFMADLALYKVKPASAEPYNSTRLEDISLRASGPIARLKGQDLTLSLTAQQLWEGIPHIPGAASFHLSTRSRSLFGELRAPLEDVLGVRGLELQAAARHQTGRIRFVYGGFAKVRKSAGLYLIGLKAEPVRGLILRGAFASGAQLPDPAMYMNLRGTDGSNLIDPKRDPNRPISADGWFWSVSGGAPDLKPDQIRTYSAGVVLSSPLVPRTRLSVDYTRIEGHDLLVQVHRGSDFYILNEDRLPGTVIRAPLTDADRARGYTGGKILEVRDLNENSGSSLIQAVDMTAQHDLDLAGGRLSLSATATWQPTLLSRNAPDNWLGKRTPDGGAPDWRGAAGVRWSTANFSASATARYVAANIPTSLVARSTVDLALGWSLPRPLGASETELRLGVRNLFDRWSIDDPLKRRLEATLIARF
ncbi:TonB-dependent receptor [Caulobacter sp.]|uniref:TonB-dependent receptor n=1 Tax=Caulobacter sp. TaxID=78 RepID=UPI001B278A1E|nr:TonB-dependent receptor [Caulobacter sp.]MBO9543613.1 TonB-dependent receptor [Caulobacter sp.]